MNWHVTASRAVCRSVNCDFVRFKFKRHFDLGCMNWLSMNCRGAVAAWSRLKTRSVVWTYLTMYHWHHTLEDQPDEDEWRTWCLILLIVWPVSLKDVIDADKWGKFLTDHYSQGSKIFLSQNERKTDVSPSLELKGFFVPRSCLYCFKLDMYTSGLLQRRGERCP